MRTNAEPHGLNLDAGVPVMRIVRRDGDRGSSGYLEVQKIIPAHRVHHRAVVITDRHGEMAGAYFSRKRGKDRLVASIHVAISSKRLQMNYEHSQDRKGNTQKRTELEHELGRHCLECRVFPYGFVSIA